MADQSEKRTPKSRPDAKGAREPSPILDDKGKPISVGDTVLTTAYDGRRVPLWLSGSKGKLIGFTRQGSVKMQFFGERYDEVLPYRSVPPNYLRVMESTEEANDVGHRPEAVGR